MNARLTIFLAAVACCGLALAVSAGSIPEDELVRMGMKRAFRESSSFFANQIEKNQAEAEAQKNIRSTIKATRDKFQRNIDANKNAPVPVPTNPEVGVYLHDEAEPLETASEIADIEVHEAPSAADESNLGLGGLFAEDD